MLGPIDTNRPRAMAEAITRPSAVLLAGAGASAAILGGLPLAAAAAVGVAAWALRVAAALPRRKRPERIDPFAVGEPWRAFVQDAIDADRRFERVVAAVRPGPLRERLGEVGERIGEGVRACWVIAQHGDRLEGALVALRVDVIRRDLAAVDAELARGHRQELEAAARSLRDQLRSAERLMSVTRDTHDRLRRINAQLDEAVARAVELSVNVDLGGVTPLGTDVDALVGELESLRQALEETGGTTAGGMPQTGTA